MPDLNSIDKGTAREAAKPPEDESIWKTIGGGLTNPENYFLLMEILGSADPSGRPLQMIGELGEAHYARKRKKQLVDEMRGKYPDIPEALAMQADAGQLLSFITGEEKRGDSAQTRQEQEKFLAAHPDVAANVMPGTPPGTVTSALLKATKGTARSRDPRVIALAEELAGPGNTPTDAQYGQAAQMTRDRDRAAGTQDFGTRRGMIEAGQERARNKKVTAFTQNKRDTAGTLLKMIPSIDKMIDEQSASLGPAAGRWNEIWTGKAGAPNPGFKKLMTKVKLLSSALMVMHVGSRGGERLRESFEGMLGTGQQSPENLHAALDAIREYAQQVSQGDIKLEPEESTLGIPEGLNEGGAEMDEGVIP